MAESRGHVTESRGHVRDAEALDVATWRTLEGFPIAEGPPAGVVTYECDLEGVATDLTAAPPEVQLEWDRQLLESRGIDRIPLEYAHPDEQGRGQAQGPTWSVSVEY